MFLFCSNRSLFWGLLLVFSCCIVGRGMGEVTDEDKKNFLAYAEEGNLTQLTNLFEKYKNEEDQKLLLSAKDIEERTALHLAAQSGNLDLVKYL